MIGTSIASIIYCILFRSKEVMLFISENIKNGSEIKNPLPEIREEWERTFDAIPDLIAILDAKHKVVRVNQAMADRLNVSPESCIGVECFAAVHGSTCPPDF